MISTSGREADFLASVGFGEVPGYARVAALGNTPDTDGTEDIWSGGGTYPWMTGATALEIVSASANDTSAGTGARTVTINGLNASHVEVSQTVTLNGTTPVAIPTSLYRINTALIMSAGSGKVNAGDVTIRDAGAGATRSIIPAGYGITRQSQYTVPAGKLLSIHSILLCINRPSTARDATVATYVQPQSGMYRLPLEISFDGNPYRHDGLPGIILSEKPTSGYAAPT